MTDEDLGNAVFDLVHDHEVAFWQLMGTTGSPDERKAALEEFVVAAWGLGYGTGLRRGAKALRDAVVEALPK